MSRFRSGSVPHLAALFKFLVSLSRYLRSWAISGELFGITNKRAFLRDPRPFSSYEAMRIPQLLEKDNGNSLLRLERLEEKVYVSFDII
jgi:hypothetical protein